MSTTKSGSAPRKWLFVSIFLTAGLTSVSLYFIFILAGSLEGNGLHQLLVFVVFICVICIVMLVSYLYSDLCLSQSRVEDLERLYDDAERRCEDFRLLIKGALEQEPDVEKSINAYLVVCAERFLKTTTDFSVELRDMKLQGEEPGTGWLYRQEISTDGVKRHFWGAHAAAKAVGIAVKKKVKEYIPDLPKEGDTSVATRGHMMHSI